MDTIMVVDPNEEDYESLRGYVEPLGVQFCFAHTGAEALAYKLSDRIVAWLINIRLPDMAGLELYGYLRQRRNQLPVLMVDDHYAAAREVSVLAIGRLYYLCKPLDPSWLEALAAHGGPGKSKTWYADELNVCHVDLGK